MKFIPSFREYLFESENIRKNLSPILRAMYLKYGEQLFETIPTFRPSIADLNFIFETIVKYGFKNSNLKPIPINLRKEMDRPTELALFVISTRGNSDNIIEYGHRIEILDMSPFFIYQLTNIIAHEIIHYDDCINGVGGDAIKSAAVGAEQTYDKHGVLFQTKMEQLNDAFDLNITIKYDKNADHHLDRCKFLTIDRKTAMNREIAQALNFDKDDEIDSRILFEDEEHLTKDQAHLIEFARRVVKNMPGVYAKVLKDRVEICIS